MGLSLFSQDKDRIGLFWFWRRKPLMVWARMLAYITGTVDQELLLRNEYLAAENHILKAQIKGRLDRTDGEGEPKLGL
jgi:hypothetical protein